MKSSLALFSSILINLIISSSVVAKDQKAPDLYVYSTYFTCDSTMLSTVDKLVENEFTPLYQEAIKNKDIVNWGWMSHHTGGYWNRAIYHMSPSMKEVLEASDAMNIIAEKNKIDSNNLFGKICNRHEDYIWKILTGNQGKGRGKVGLSMYMECDITDEKRADEILTAVFAPIFNQYVGKGKFTSWGWLEHVIGGKYRRLATMTAENYEDLISTRQKVNSRLFGKNAPQESKEFSKICGSHQDYLWGIKIENS